MRKFYLFIVVAIMSIASTGILNAQSCTILFPNGQTYSLTLDNMGNATLVAADLNTFIGTTNGCTDYEVRDENDVLLPPAGRTFTCADVGMTFEFDVRTIDPAAVLLPSPWEPFNISVFDHTPPTITCPVIASPQGTDAADCNVSLPAALLAPTVADACGGISQTWSWTSPTGTTTGSDNMPDTDFETGSHTIKYYVTDGSGNLDSCTVIFTVQDDDDPIFASCPASTTIDADIDCEATLTFTPPDVSDNCAVTSYTLDVKKGGVSLAGFPQNVTAGTDVVVSGQNLGVYNATYTASDGSATSMDVTCTHAITVQDNSPPVATAPDDVTVDADGALCTATNVADIAMTKATIQDASTSPGFFDDCDDYPPLTVDYRVTDPDGTVNPWVDDDYDAGDDYTFLLGTSTVEYRIRDSYYPANAETIVSVDVTVQDVTPPGPIPADFVFPNVSNTNGSCSELISWTTPDGTGVTDCNGPVVYSAAVLSGPDLDILDGLFATNPYTGAAVVVQAQFPVGVTVVGYIFTDAANQADTTEYTFTVTDDNDPFALCESSVDLVLDDMGSAALTASQVNDGSYDECTPITFSIDQTSFDCTNVAGPNTVTLTVEDNASLVPGETNNTATCTTTVNVIDNEDPVLSNCPADMTVTSNIDSGGGNPCGATVNWVAPSTSDNCTLGAGALTSTHAIGSQFDMGVTTVTYTLTDASGNTDECSFTVTVEDNTPPVIAAMSDITINTNAACTAVATWTTPSVSDNCSSSISLTSNHLSGDVFNVGVTTVVYTANDGNGNISTESFTITVNDNIPPVAQCEPVSLYLDINGDATLDVNDIDDGSTDNCGIFSRTLSQEHFDCDDVGDNNITLTVSDGVLTDECTDVVSVYDTIKPTCLTIADGSIFSLDATGSVTIAVADINNGSWDACGIDSMSISFDGGAFIQSKDFDCATTGDYMVDLFLMDVNGNSSTCSVNITVADDSDPIANCYSVINIGTDDGVCSAYVSIPMTYDPTHSNPPIEGTYWDNCGDVTVESEITGATTQARITGNDASRDFNRGFSKVKYFFTDASGNVYDCTTKIYVEDDEAPVIDCPSDYTIEIDDIANCTVDLVLVHPVITDNCDNFDPLNPPVDGIIDMYFDGGWPYWVEGEVSTSIDDVSLGVHNVSYYAEDEEGNGSESCDFTITVEDTLPPVVTYTQADITQDNLLNNCFATVPWTRPSWAEVVDCNDPLTITETFSDVNFVPNTAFVAGAGDAVTGDFPVGVTTVTYTFCDASNNCTEVSFDVTIEDVQAPQITCPAPQTLGTICAGAVVPDYEPLLQAFDNCSYNLDIVQNPAAGTLISTLPGISDPAVDGETFTVEFTVTDAGPNPLSTTCSFVVTLVDSVDPVVDPYADLVDSCGTMTIEPLTAWNFCHDYEIDGVPSNASSVNNGPPITYNYDPGFYNITWTFVDNANNSTQVFQTIEVTEDDDNPTITCPANIIVDADNNCESVVSGLTFVADDHCGITKYEYSVNGGSFVEFASTNTLPGYAYPLGENTVAIKVTDGAGNTGDCSFIITVEDNTDPVLVDVPGDVFNVSCDDIPELFTGVTATDNCDDDVDITFAETSTQGADPSQANYYYYVITRTWTADDGHGNSVSESQNIYVDDNEAPVIDGFITDIEEDNDFGQCSAYIGLVLSADYYSDNCTDDDYLVVVNDYNGGGADASDVYPLGETIVTFWVTDVRDNTSNPHQVSVVVLDSQNPTPVCINSISLPLGNDDTYNYVVINPSLINNGSFDNCGVITAMELSIDTFDCSNVGDNTVLLTVWDDAGNSAYCETHVFIQDNDDPVITFCPDDITLECGLTPDPSVTGEPTFTDNCDASMDYSDNPAPGFSCGDITRTWTVTDASGNTASCEQIITIFDDEDPVFASVPDDMTLGCGDAIPGAVSLLATDNCAGSMTITPTEASTHTDTGCSKYEYEITRTWTATDNCSNTTEVSQTIEVFANEQPTFNDDIPDEITAVANADPDDCGSVHVPELDLSFQINSGCYEYDDVIKFNYVLENAPFGNPLPLFGDGRLDAAGYAFEEYPYGDWTIVYGIADPCLHDTVYHTILLHVLEDQQPTAICNDQLIVSLGSDGSVTITPELLNNGSEDNCDDDLDMSVFPATLDCTNLGINFVTLTVTDDSGNSNSCTSTITVVADDPELVIDVVTSSTNESYYGASDGSVTVSASGGSGNFTYNWTDENGVDVGTTTTVDGLTFGVYTIVVTDTQTGCQYTATATVESGDQVTFNIGSGCGQAGTTIWVPVTVSNFNSVTAFSYSLHIVDPSIGQIVGYEDLNPSGIDITYEPTYLTCGWVGGATDLGDGTVLFNIQILLSGDVGDASDLIIDGSPSNWEVVIATANGPLVVPSSMTAGSICVNSAAPTVTLGGSIYQNEVGTPVAQVAVVLSGDTDDIDSTGIDGLYNFTVLSNSNVTITPTKDIFPLNGVTAYDLSLILQHIVHVDTLDSPYKLIAADADASGSINSFDLSALLTMIVNPLTADFGDYGNTSWRFVDASYVFAAFDPYTEPIPAFPESYSDANILNNTTVDFIGVKIGDINLDSDATLFTGNGTTGTRSTWNLMIENTVINAGDIIELPLIVSSREDLIAIQMGIECSENIEILDVEGYSLPNISTSNFNITDNLMTMVWFTDRGVDLEGGSELFTIKVRAINDIADLKNEIYISNSVIDSKVYNSNGDDASLNINFSTIDVIDNQFSLLQNIPNPFENESVIQFNLPESSEVEIMIYNVSGEIVWRTSDTFSKGLNSVIINKKNNLQESGIYFCKVISGDNEGIIKMVLLK